MTTLTDAERGALIRDCYARLSLLVSVGLTVPALAVRAESEAQAALSLLDRAQQATRERMRRGK